MKIGDVKPQQVGVGGVLGTVQVTFANTVASIRAGLTDPQKQFIVSNALDTALLNLKQEVIPNDKFEARATTNQDGKGGYVNGQFYTYKGALEALDKLATLDVATLSHDQQRDLGKLFAALLTEDPSKSAVGFIDVGKSFGLG